MQQSPLTKAVEAGTSDIYIRQLYKLFRTKAKKLEKIAQLETKERKNLDQEQLDKIRHKPELVAGIKDINSFYDLYVKSKKEESKAEQSTTQTDTTEVKNQEQQVEEESKETPTTNEPSISVKEHEELLEKAVKDA